MSTIDTCVHVSQIIASQMLLMLPHQQRYSFLFPCAHCIIGCSWLIVTMLVFFQNGMRSLCPTICLKHRRWLLMSMICLNPFACVSWHTYVLPISLIIFLASILCQYIYCGISRPITCSIIVIFLWSYLFFIFIVQVLNLIN